MKTLPLTNENELLAGLAYGDEKAFGIIFHHYRPKIYAYAFHLCRDPHLADELVQETFLKCWLHRDKIPQVFRFDNWLFTIARNQVFDMLKVMAREEAFRREAGDDRQPVVNPVEEQLLGREVEVRLREAVDQLPPRQKLIFTLSRHKGLKHEEIAEELQISRHTVKTHLVRALKALRNTLKFFFL